MSKKSFFEILTKSNTDKVTHHGYQFFYPVYLEKFRDTTDAMIEIGILFKESLNAWIEYFDKTFVYGLDINLEEKNEKYDIIKCDQSSEEQLNNFIANINRSIFFVIDDGSHIPEHQILTFNKLFNILKPGGVYIIEDIETSYWNKLGLYGYETHYGYKHPKSIVEIFKNIIDDVNSEFLNEENKILQDELTSDTVNKNNREWIQSIVFGQNCIIILKKNEEEYNYFKREYRFKDRI
jgi:hypothetical protein